MSGVDISTEMFDFVNKSIQVSNNFCEQIVIIHAVICVENINIIDYTLSRNTLCFG